MGQAHDDPPCGHREEDVRSDGYRARCLVCGSFWDAEHRDADVAYDATYLEARDHADERVGSSKVRALRGWLAACGLAPLAGRRVCEVGFGGGHCLAWLAEEGAEAWGIEASDAHARRARELGLPAERVLRFDGLPETLGAPVDLWLFLDSFEHLPDPAGFVDWLARSSAADARLLVVAPEAGSPSERLLGRAWPHRLVDHPFHWSRRGLTGFLAERGFELERAFRPLKRVALRTAVDHLAHKLGAPGLRGLRWIPGWTLPFNVGEMGLLFRRAGEPRA